MYKLAEERAKAPVSWIGAYSKRKGYWAIGHLCTDSHSDARYFGSDINPCDHIEEVAKNIERHYEYSKGL